MVGRHLRAHKWFAQCMELLQFVDPKGLIGDSTVRTATTPPTHPLAGTASYRASPLLYVYGGAHVGCSVMVLQIRDIDKLVEEGKELLGLTWDEDDNDDMQQDAAPDKGLVRAWAAAAAAAGQQGSMRQARLKSSGPCGGVSAGLCADRCQGRGRRGGQLLRERARVRAGGGGPCLPACLAAQQQREACGGRKVGSDVPLRCCWWWGVCRR